MKNPKILLIIPFVLILIFIYLDLTKSPTIGGRISIDSTKAKIQNYIYMNLNFNTLDIKKVRAILASSTAENKNEIVIQAFGQTKDYTFEDFFGRLGIKISTSTHQ